MYNQEIFDSQFLHFHAEHIQRSIRSERWENQPPLPLILMCPCDSGTQFLAKLPPNPALKGVVRNDFLTPEGHAYSIISLIFEGIMIRIDGFWNVLVDLGSQEFSFRIPRPADVGLVPSPSAVLEAIPRYIESYVRSHRHSLISFELLPA